MISLGLTTVGRSGKLQNMTVLSEGMSGLSQHISNYWPAFNYHPLPSAVSEVLISLPLSSNMRAQVLWGLNRRASVNLVINL